MNQADVLLDPDAVVAALHPDDIEAFGPALEAARAGAAPPSLNVRMQTAASGLRWVTATFVATPARGVLVALDTIDTTILVVDDADDLGELVASVLAGAGHAVLRASSAEEALAVSDGRHVDLLLTDVTMPGSTGPELAARMRRDRPGLSVLFMSGFAPQASELRDALHLQKPFSLASLRAQVDRALRRSGAQARGSTTVAEPPATTSRPPAAAASASRRTGSSSVDG